MSKYEFAIHGMEGEILIPNAATVIMRSTQAGLVLTLPKGGGNWVHFAFTSPKFINDKPMSLVKIWLRYSVGDDALIDSIAVHDESVAVYESPLHEVGEINKLLVKQIQPHQINSGIVISVHVSVQADGAELAFVGAGMELIG